MNDQPSRAPKAKPIAERKNEENITSKIRRRWREESPEPLDSNDNVYQKSKIRHIAPVIARAPEIRAE